MIGFLDDGLELFAFTQTHVFALDQSGSFHRLSGSNTEGLLPLPGPEDFQLGIREIKWHEVVRESQDRAILGSLLTRNWLDTLRMVRLDISNLTDVEEDILINPKPAIVPNPTNGPISIYNLPEVDNVRIINQIGQEVARPVLREIGTDTYAADLGFLAAGVYFLRIAADGKLTWETIVVQ